MTHYSGGDYQSKSGSKTAVLLGEITWNPLPTPGTMELYFRHLGIRNVPRLWGVFNSGVLQN